MGRWKMKMWFEGENVRKHVMNMFEYLLWSQENHLNRNICSLMRFGSKNEEDSSLAFRGSFSSAHETAMQRGSMALIDGTE